MIRRLVWGTPREGTRPTGEKEDSAPRLGTPREGTRPTTAALVGRVPSPGASRHNRVETERFKSFAYDDLMKRDKVNLDIFWLKDESL